MPGTDHHAHRHRAPATARGRRPRSTAGPLAALAALALAVFATGCEPARDPYAQRPEVVHRGHLGAPPGSPRATYAVPGPAWERRGVPWPERLDFSARPRRLHPELVDWLATSPDTAHVRVVVALRGGLAMPRLPLEELSEPAGSPRLAAARVTIAHLLDSLRVRRRPEATGDSLWLAHEFGAVVHESYWIVRAASITVRRDSLVRLAYSPRVASLDPAVSHERPPGVGPPTSAGRAAVGLGDGNTLARFGWDRGPLALLDTGAEPSYPLLARLRRGADASPDEPALDRWECVTSTEVRPDTRGDAEDTGHGTFSAAILVGSDPERPEFGGGTRAHLNLYRIYHDAPGTPPSSEALLRTLEAAAGQSGVVGVELQVLGDVEGTASRAANQVASSGAAILAAMGDYGPDVLGAPGSARHVLGVGARDLSETARTAEGQSWNRSVTTLAKPELQAPTGTGMPRLEDPQATRDYDLTSGAVPYATAAAFVLRNWLTDGVARTDAGQVYAALLACGENPRPAVAPRFPLSEGVGVTRLPAAGTVWWGCTEIGSFGVATIPLTEARTDLHARYRVAIWWSDPAPYFGIPRHADFDLYLTHPAAPGGVFASSVTPRGTFERIEFVPPRPAALADVRGDASLRIVGRRAGLKPVRVYWAAIGSD